MTFFDILGVFKFIRGDVDFFFVLVHLYTLCSRCVTIDTFQNHQKIWKIRQNTCFSHQGISVTEIFHCEKVVSQPVWVDFDDFFVFALRKNILEQFRAFVTIFYDLHGVKGDVRPGRQSFSPEGCKILTLSFKSLKDRKGNFTIGKNRKSFSLLKIVKEPVQNDF